MGSAPSTSACRSTWRKPLQRGAAAARCKGVEVQHGVSVLERLEPRQAEVLAQVIEHVMFTFPEITSAAWYGRGSTKQDEKLSEAA